MSSQGSGILGVKNRGMLLCIVVIVVAVGIFLWCRSSPPKERLSMPTPMRDPSEELHYKPGFLPSHQGPWFQNLPPSLRVENNYHSCIQENGGDYGNYELRQKCYVKTLKDGTYDKADLMCWRHKDNEDDYYACLDFIYAGGNNWMDRGTSSGFCVCEDGSKGILEADGTCFCPRYRPMHDRRMVDENDEIVDRL
jgi:hypothetical protein